jgi:hypothetical protein
VAVALLVVVAAFVSVVAKTYVNPLFYALLYALAAVNGWYIARLIVVGCLATMWLIFTRLDP